MKHFRTYQQGNSFIRDRDGLTLNEWTDAIKLSTGYANLAGIYPNTSYSQTLCRRCHRETETLGHVLGNCDFGEKKRTARHHAVKYQLAGMLREKGLVCMDEVYCTDGKSRRYIDIMAIDGPNKKVFFIDPTVRLETNDDVGDTVMKEKKRIYDPCFPDLRQRYELQGFELETIGLWVGARGAISEQMIDFFHKFELDEKKLKEIGLNALIASISMINHHIYA